MDIDLTPLVQALAALALAAISAATPYLAPLLRRYLHIRLTATQAAAIQSAADAGAQGRLRLHRGKRAPAIGT